MKSESALALTVLSILAARGSDGFEQAVWIISAAAWVVAACIRLWHDK